METISVFYNGLGYLGLVGAILWGILFVGDGSYLSLMDAAGSVPLPGAWIDAGLLLAMMVLHRLISRGLVHAVSEGLIPEGCGRGTQSWAAGVALCVIYAFWQPLPKILWTTPDSVQWVMSTLFYIGVTLIFIGLLSCHFDFFQDDGMGGEALRNRSSRNTAEDANKSLAELLGEPIHGGVLVAVWASSSMTEGHLLLACAFTLYSVLDAFWSVWKSGGREEGDTMSLEVQRLSRN